MRRSLALAPKIPTLLLTATLLALCRPARADNHVYALVIGNNAAPLDSAGTATLRYADDDAARYYEFFSRFATEVRLLTVFDADSQRRYPSLVEVAQVPSHANLERAVEQFAAMMRADREQGDEAVYYLVFSGHGTAGSDGAASLALTDGGLTQQQLYDNVLAKLPATYGHLIIDACHAEAVVGLRGQFDVEVDAETTAVSAEQARMFLNRRQLSRFPNVGVILATTSTQEAHEWSRLESGVFTHELLSALSGAADVNGDGKIEYTEAQAFIAAANRQVKDPRAAPQVVAMPPGANHHAALASLASMNNVTLLAGDLAKLGHFSVELANDQRILEANLGDSSRATIAVPRAEHVFLRTSDREVEFSTSSGSLVDLSVLRLNPAPTVSRGAIDFALREGLFATPFGASYYSGYVDSVGAIGVAVAQPLGVKTALPRRPWYGSPLTAAFMGSGATALVASAVSSVFMLKERGAVASTSLQRSAYEANLRYETYRSVAIGSALFAAGTAFVSWLLWPRGDSASSALSGAP